MVYEHLSKCFIPNDPFSKFSKLLQATNVIAHGDILKSMAVMLGASKLLVMAKDTRGLYFCKKGVSLTY